jgi:Type VI secretion system VasI, EvfG, VC_A0118
MRAPLIAIVLCGVGRAVCAQPADEGSKMLDTCFELARTADAVCSDPKNGGAERLDCRQKASMAQLECLERVFPGRSAGSAPPEMPARAVSPEMPAVTAAPEVPAGSASPERPIGTVAKSEPTSSQKAPAGTAPAETPVATVSPEMTTGAALPGVPARHVDIPAMPQDTHWIVSETTSPVDYSPLITAVIRSTTSLQDAPNTLVIRCLGPRTEVLLRTQGTWRASRSNTVQVDYQVNDQPLARLQWITSADGKTASYGNDAVGLLQSLPDGARLKINVLDRTGAGHEATFQLAGLDAVRKRIAGPCKWATAADKISSGKR